MAFDGNYYARDGQSLVPMNIEKIELIRGQSILDYWSAKIISKATIEDLDEEAIQLARKNFGNKFPDKAEELKNWDNVKFLDKAKLTIKGKITRTALILLGKEEADYYLSPSEIKIRWKLIDKDNNDLDYDIFGIPLLLAVEKIFAKIRNLKYRYMQEGTIFPNEVSKFEPFSIREALNNCIAHQDYTKGARINIIESEDQLIFSNYGSFIPESVEKVVLEDTPEEFYRNRFLATAMFNLKMVDTAGGGIKKMFNFQRERFFPLPDYDLTKNKVEVTLTGKILDINYALLLARDKTLSLEEIMMLDKVQKRKKLDKFEEKYLKNKHLIEGRKPNYFVCKSVLQKIGQKAEYSRYKGFEKQYYLDLILKALKEHKNLDRQDIDKLLWDKLPDILENKQKKSKVNHLLSELKNKGLIENKGSLRYSIWVLTNK